MPLHRFDFGFPSEHTDEDFADYVPWILENFEKEGYKNESLLESFEMAFENFTQEMFAKIPVISRKKLREFLRKNGVYVPIKLHLQIAKALHTVLTTRPEWPEGEKERTVIDNSPVTPVLTNAMPPISQNEQIGSGSHHHPTSYGSSRSSSVSSLCKVYSYNTSKKYTGAYDDDLKSKLVVFEERCDQNNVQRSEKLRALSAMLDGSALTFFLNRIKPHTNQYGEAINMLRTRFETKERMISLTREWDGTHIKKFFAKYPEKEPNEVLQKMVDRLEYLQLCLPSSYRTDEMLMAKLLISVDTVKCFDLARQKPATTVEGIIADLHTSISTYPKPPTDDVPTVNMTDRKRRVGTYSHRGKKRCFVCGSEGCWSTKHSRQERMEALKKNKGYRTMMASINTPEDNADTEMDDALDIIEGTVVNFMDTDNWHDAQDDQPESEMQMHSYLAEASVLHTLSRSVQAPKRYTSDVFQGILLDTGASYASTSSKDQYKAYCAFVGLPQKIKPSSESTIRFGKGTSKSYGTATIAFPIGVTTLAFEVHILEDATADIPVLMSLQDMDRLRVSYDNLTDTLLHAPTSQKGKVTRKYGHPFYRWCNITSCFYTEQELSRLHRRFGHPGSDKLYNLLKAADIEQITPKTRSTIEKIAKHCRLCQLHGQSPRRFKFHIRTEKDFNQVVYLDMMYIANKPLLHVVCEATRYQAARWLVGTTADDIWRAFRLCWCDVYIGPPDLVVHDAGTNIMAKAFQDHADLMHIETKPVPREAANSMTYVERYHAPLRRAYKIIEKEAPGMDREAVLQCAVKSVNDSVGPDGLVPTLLVYGALPRLGLPTDRPSPTAQQRALAVRKATKAMSQHFAKRQVKDALRARNGPNVSSIHSAPLGSLVLVYRIVRCKWDGPYKLLNRQGETCTLMLPEGPRQYRTTVCKPYHPPLPTPTQQESSGNETSSPPNPIAHVNMCMTYRGELDKSNEFTDDELIEAFLKESKETNSSRFEQSRMKELKGLIEKGVFLPVPKSEAANHRLFGTRFVDIVKHPGTPQAYEKSRLVVQGYNDDADGLLTHSPTVQRSSQRLLLALAPSFPDWTIASRDVKQAYTQSKQPLSRPIFVKPPKEFGLTSETILKVQCPLYGIPEAGISWFWTYVRHHRELLHMKSADHDMCLLYTADSLEGQEKSKYYPVEKEPRAITCLQTDDTLILANKKFLELESTHARRFETNPLQTLTRDAPLKFNGATVKYAGENLILNSAHNVQKLRCIAIEKEKSVRDCYVSQRARAAYITSVCRPDLQYRFAYAAQFPDPTLTEAKYLNKGIQELIDTSERGLTYVKLDIDSMYLALFVDASFAGNKDLTSQLGFILCLMDGKNKCNIVHYGSSKSKRVTRSVLSAELYSMSYGFDSTSLIRHTLELFLGRTIKLKLLTDSKCLFDALTSLNTTTEKRLLIDLNILRQSYERREITEVAWIPGGSNPADALTKDKPCDALTSLMETNHIKVSELGWIERDSLPKQSKSD